MAAAQLDLGEHMEVELTLDEKPGVITMGARKWDLRWACGDGFTAIAIGLCYFTINEAESSGFKGVYARFLDGSVYIELGNRQIVIERDCNDRFANRFMNLLNQWCLKLNKARREYHCVTATVTDIEKRYATIRTNEGETVRLHEGLLPNTSYHVGSILHFSKSYWRNRRNQGY